METEIDLNRRLDGPNVKWPRRCSPEQRLAELPHRLPTSDDAEVDPGRGTRDDLQRLVKRTPVVSRARRVAMLAATACLPILFALFMVVGMYLVLQWNKQHPEINRLRRCLTYLDRDATKQADQQTPSSSEARREALEIYIAGNFRDTITDRETWYSMTALTIPQPQRATAERIIAERPQPSPAELQAAITTIDPILKKIQAREKSRQTMPPVAFIFPQFFATWFVLVTVPGLIAALTVRRGLMMRVFGVDLVTRSGRPASRLRRLWRAAVFNAPFLLGPFAFALIAPLSPHERSLWAANAVPLGIAAAMLVITAWSLLLPVRGLSDRLSGTYLVPR